MIENKIICGDWIKELKKLPDGIFHSCVCSPPYWGQRLYLWGTDNPCDGKMMHHNWIVEGYLQTCRNCGAKAPVFGIEKTPEEHIEKLVEGFGEVRRVLRPDGVLFLNYGDKYTGGGNGGGGKQDTNPGSLGALTAKCMPDGNLLMLPARVAIALQADGWILRDDVIWAKAISFNDKYSGSTMPESVNGTRWERHRIKVEDSKRSPENYKSSHIGQSDAIRTGKTGTGQAIYQPCPGCPKCEKNGGLVLRRGSWRCTKAHEHLFQFVKTNDYFCDMEAVKEAYNYDGRKDTTLKPTKKYQSRSYGQNPNSCHKQEQERWPGTGRNLRNVWTINPRGYKEAHYATYPEKLVEPCIKVATSSKGVCPKCGAQWARVVETTGGTIGQSWHDHGNDIGAGQTQGKHPGGVGAKEAREGNPYKRTTLGWKSTCDCGIDETVPALVLDPFMGSGTTAVVAAKLNRNYFGIEINPEYKNNHIDERVKEAETGIPIKVRRAGQKGLFENRQSSKGNNQ